MDGIRQLCFYAKGEDGFVVQLRQSQSTRNLAAEHTGPETSERPTTRSETGQGSRDERNRNQGTQTELLVGEEGGWDVIWLKRCSKRRGDGSCVAHVTAYTV